MADHWQIHPQQSMQQLFQESHGHETMQEESPIDRLPVDVLTLIAELLDYVSLLDFTTTCRKNMLASYPAKFRVVRLSFTTPESLNAAIERAVVVLSAANGQDHIRHLEVVTSSEGPEGAVSGLNRTSRRHLQSVDPFYSDHMQMYHRRLFKSPEQWRPLSNFVQELNGLMELTWASVERIPVQLVRALSASSRIKLNLYGLDVPILAKPDDSVELSPDAIEIVTAPALYSLSCACPLGPLEPHHYLGILADMIAGAAPHLRDVHVSTTLPPAEYLRSLRMLPRRRPWPQGKLLPSSATTSPSLRSLSLSRPVPMAFLQRCSINSPIQALKALTIVEDVSRIDSAWLSVQTLTNMERLTFKINPRRASSQHPDQSAFLSLVRALPRLTHLDFDFTLDHIALRHISEVCGHRLKRLNAGRCFVNLPLVQQLRRSCPHIEELSLGMHRWAGSIAESNIYQAFGTFRSLEVLQLRIRSFQAETCCDTYDSLWSDATSLMDISYFDEPELDQAYHALRDLAFDEKLARSIYRMISSCKPSNARPLDRLDLWIDSELGRNADYMLGDGGVPFILQRITHSWHCVRDLCDLRQQQCFIHSKQPHLRQGFYIVETNEQRTKHVEKLISGPVIRAVYLAWPDTQHRPFVQAWHSFPLSSNESHSC